MKKATLFTVALVMVSVSLAFAAGQEGQGATGGPLELDVFLVQNPGISSVTDNQERVLLEDMFNVKFDLVVATAESSGEKQQLLLASGDYPSVFFMGRISRADQMKYGRQGVLIPLNPLIEKWGPNIQIAFEKMPTLEPAITTPDGNIYSLPGAQECYHCIYSQKQWINTEWLNKLGLEMPTSTDEYERVLLAFKNNDPNDNDKANEIPLSGAIQWWHAEPQHFLMSAFIYDDGRDYLRLRDGDIDMVADDAEWREGLKYLSRLYSQGLIDPQAFTQKIDQLRTLGNNPDTVILGATAAGHIGGVVSLEDRERYTQYRVIPPIRGPREIRLAGYYPPESDRFDWGSYAITNKATAQQAELATKIIDWLFTTEGSLTASFGPQGVGWDWAGQGDLGMNGEQAIFKLAEVFDAQGTTRNTSWSHVAFWPNELMMGWAQNQDITTPEGYERLLVVESKKYEPYAPKRDAVQLNFYMSDEDMQKISLIKTEIRNYIEQNMAAFITGQQNIESEWDSYVAGFKGLGIAEYLQLIQKYYDAVKE